MFGNDIFDMCPYSAVRDRGRLTVWPLLKIDGTSININDLLLCLVDAYNHADDTAVVILKTTAG